MWRSSKRQCAVRGWERRSSGEEALRRRIQDVSKKTRVVCVVCEARDERVVCGTIQLLSSRVNSIQISWPTYHSSQAAPKRAASPHAAEMAHSIALASQSHQGRSCMSGIAGYDFAVHDSTSQCTPHGKHGRNNWSNAPWHHQFHRQNRPNTRGMWQYRATGVVRAALAAMAAADAALRQMLTSRRDAAARRSDVRRSTIAGLATQRLRCVQRALPPRRVGRSLLVPVGASPGTAPPRRGVRWPGRPWLQLFIRALWMDGSSSLAEKSRNGPRATLAPRAICIGRFRRTASQSRHSSLSACHRSVLASTFYGGI